MPRPRWAPAIAALILSAACGRDTRAPRSVAGFEAPESARYDRDLDVWYVANINGSPVARDGNGYISRLHGDGNVIRAWTPGSNATIPLATTRGQLDGVEIIDAERLLVTSWTDSSLSVLENGTVTPVAGDLHAVELLMENRVEFRTLATAERVTP